MQLGVRRIFQSCLPPCPLHSPLPATDACPMPVCFLPSAWPLPVGTVCPLLTAACPACPLLAFCLPNAWGLPARFLLGATWHSPTRYLSSACALPACYLPLSTGCLRSATLYHQDAFSLHSRCLPAPCSLPGRWTLAACPRCVRWCPLPPLVSCLLPVNCLPTACQLPAHCLLSACPLPPLAACPLPASCQPAACPLPISCLIA